VPARPYAVSATLPSRFITHLPPDSRADLPPAPARAERPTGATLWFTGLPSAGKTTVARAVAARLCSSGRPVEVLDGDEVRAALSPELGYSRADRDVNVARIGWVAELLSRNGVLVLAPVVSPYREGRRGVRTMHDASGTRFLEIHVATPIEVCAERDVKGLYASHRSGQLAGLTGTGGRDGDYEPPIDPEARINTTDRAVDEIVDELCVLLRKENLL
jgi:adenylylsulfate kinase